VSKLVIKIQTNGNLKTLYTEKIPLNNLGKLTVERASNVEFDSTKGTWSVRVVETDKVIGTGFALRSEALKFEVKHLNETLSQN